MTNRNNRLEYRLGRILAYLIIAIATILITTGSVALLKLLIGFILA